MGSLPHLFPAGQLWFNVTYYFPWFYHGVVLLSFTVGCTQCCLFPWSLLPAHSCESFLSFLLPGDVIYLWCFCVYVVCVCAWNIQVCLLVSLCVCGGGGQRLSLVPFFIVLHLIFESNLSLNSELTILARLAGQWIPGTLLSLSPQGWVMRLYHNIPDFYGCARDPNSLPYACTECIFPSETSLVLWLLV